MATPTSDQGTQHNFLSPRKLLNEAISIITQNFTPSKFINRTIRTPQTFLTNSYSIIGLSYESVHYILVL